MTFRDQWARRELWVGAAGRLVRRGSLVLAATICFVTGPAGATVYTFTDLGTLGGKSSQAMSINNRGQVVGFSLIAGAPDNVGHAFLYESGTMRDLGCLPGGNYSSARKINDSGVVVGTSSDGDINSVAPWPPSGPWTYHGVLFDSSGIRDLGVDREPMSINAAGQVAGYSRVDNVTYHGFLYDGAFHDLGSPIHQSSHALDINRSGQIAGYFLGGYYRAVIYDAGGWRELGTLGGTESFAQAINDAGQVVGSSKLLAGDAQEHAFLYDTAGMRDLGTLGGRTSWGYGINNLGQVVGAADTASSPSSAPHPFLYSGGRMIDMADRLATRAPWDRLVVRAINDRGQIVGEAIWGDGTPTSFSHAVLLTPTPAPALSISEVGLSFVQPAGTTSQAQTLTLTNEGELPLAIDSLTLTGPDAARFAIARDSGERTLAPGASRTVEVTFTPPAWGEFSATLELHHNDLRPGSPRAVELHGSDTIPDGHWYPASLAFGDQLAGTRSDEKTVRIQNLVQAHAPLAIREIRVEGPGASAFVVSDPSGSTLLPGQSRTVGVRFAPGARGAAAATLVVVTNNADPSLMRVELTGRGIVALVEISPASLVFGSQPVGTATGTQSVILQNSGDLPVDLGSVTLTGAQAGDFAVTADGWSGRHLLPGSVVTLNLRFTPGGAGTRGASLLVSDTAEGSPHTVALSGEGVAAQASLSPAALTFGEQRVGTSSGEQAVVLSNTGSAPLTIYGVSFAGANPEDFTPTTDLGGFTLGAGRSGTLRLRFTPHGPGSRSATLTISDSAEGSPHTVAVSGTGTAPSLTVGISQLGSPTSVSFGEQALGGTSARQTVTISNTGTAPLTVTGISLAGAQATDFALADGGAGSLAPGASRTVTVTFTPLGTGRRTASLTIASDAAGSPAVVALTGTGIVAASGKAAVPTVVTLVVTAVDGTAMSTRRAVISVGQSVTFRLQVQYRNGAQADVSTDGNTRLFANAPLGRFTAKNVWTPRPEDSGRTLVFYGRYYSPVTRRPFVDQVVVSVKRSPRRR